MVSQDLANELIALIKTHAWAVEMFCPELHDELAEVQLSDKLTLFIKAFKPLIHEQKVLTTLEQFLCALNDENIRKEFISEHTLDERKNLTAPLLCTLAIKITGTGLDLNAVKAKYTEIFPHMDSRDITQWGIPMKQLLAKTNPPPPTEKKLILSQQTQSSKKNENPHSGFSWGSKKM